MDNSKTDFGVADAAPSWSPASRSFNHTLTSGCRVPSYIREASVDEYDFVRYQLSVDSIYGECHRNTSGELFWESQSLLLIFLYPF